MGYRHRPRRHGNKNQRRTNDAAPERKQSDDEQSASNSEPPPTIPAANPEIENPHPAADTTTSNQDQHNIERRSDAVIASWTRVLGISTIFLFLATAGTGLVLLRTDKNIEHQAGIMRSQLEEMQAEQRPWVYASDITPAGRITLVEGQYAIPLKFFIRNPGHLPAFSVITKTSATILPIGRKSSMTIKNDICDAYRKSPIMKTGSAIFAGQTITHGGLTSDDYPRVSKESWDAISGDKLLLMFGCIDYQFPAEAGHHQSRFSYAVG